MPSSSSLIGRVRGSFEDLLLQIVHALPVICQRVYHVLAIANDIINTVGVVTFQQRH